MGLAAVIREKIESSLAARIPAALSPRLYQAPELLRTGIVEVDTLLEGGLPLGSLTEITGPMCSGRSTLAASILAEATRHGASCAYVDAADAFDPLSAAAIGIDLRRLLWIRAGRSEMAATFENEEAPSDTPRRAISFAPAQETHCSGAGRHPRAEIQGMDVAVEKLFRSESSLLRDRDGEAPVNPTPRCSESMRGRNNEQVAIDRQPARRGDVVLNKDKVVLDKDKKVAVPRSTDFFQQPSLPAFKNHSKKENWTTLDRALRATDLLLNTGGFRVIVLDMGDVRPEQVRRIPLTSWYRYRLQAEKSQTLFLVLTQILCARSCASVVLHCREAKERWQYAAEQKNQDGWPLLAGFQYSVNAERKRASHDAAYSFKKKPVSSTGTSCAETFWKRTTVWAR